MPDYIKLAVDRVYLTDEAVKPTTTSDGFKRAHYVTGKGADAVIILSYCIDGYAVVKIRAVKVRDGRWWVTHVEANLTALVYGHGGRGIKDDAEVYVGLTRLAHILKPVVKPECHSRLIPGVGQCNLGFIRRWECMIQIQDPDHAFLIGSHVARLKYQHKTNRVHPTESTLLTTRKSHVSIYDKDAQLRHGVRWPEEVPGTRIEVVMKDERRLAEDAKTTKDFIGAAGPVLATLNLDTEYKILRNGLMKMTGIGWLADRALMASLSKNAKLIAGALGSEITNVGRLDLALHSYKVSCKPSANVFRKVEQELRAYAFRLVVPNPLAFAPVSYSDLQWSEVHWIHREEEWAVQMRDIGAPNEPDPIIAYAWSKTTFLAKKPHPYELAGTIAPGNLPFIQTL